MIRSTATFQWGLYGMFCERSSVQWMLPSHCGPLLWLHPTELQQATVSQQPDMSSRLFSILCQPTFPCAISVWMDLPSGIQTMAGEAPHPIFHTPWQQNPLQRALAAQSLINYNLNYCHEMYLFCKGWLINFLKKSDSEPGDDDAGLIADEAGS